MTDTLRPPDARTHANTDRTGSQSPHAELDKVRAGSHQLRIGVTEAKRIYLEAVNEVRAEMDLSVEAMAINACESRSVMSDALKGKGRNFNGAWTLAQGEEFHVRVNRRVDRKLGLTADSVDELEAAAIARTVELLVRRGFRARAVGQ